MKTEKINQVLKYIPTKKITELNEPIYAGVKLVCEKISFPLKSTNQKSKRTQEKNNKENWGNKVESTDERRTIKKISTRVNQYRKNRKF